MVPSSETAAPDAKSKRCKRFWRGQILRTQPIGMSTGIPTGTRLLSLSVTDDTATVNLSNDFRSDGAPMLPAITMQLRVAFGRVQRHIDL